MVNPNTFLRARLRTNRLCDDGGGGLCRGGERVFWKAAGRGWKTAFLSSSPPPATFWPPLLLLRRRRTGNGRRRRRRCRRPEKREKPIRTLGDNAAAEDEDGEKQFTLSPSSLEHFSGLGFFSPISHGTGRPNGDRNRTPHTHPTYTTEEGKERDAETRFRILGFPRKIRLQISVFCAVKIRFK